MHIALLVAETYKKIIINVQGKRNMHCDVHRVEFDDFTTTWSIRHTPCSQLPRWRAELEGVEASKMNALFSDGRQRGCNHAISRSTALDVVPSKAINKKNVLRYDNLATEWGNVDSRGWNDLLICENYD